MDLTIYIEGIAPLIMHDGQLADPLSDGAKQLAQLTKKKGKTEDDHRAIGRVESAASLYWSDELGVYLPAQNVEACFKKAAGAFKLGSKLPAAFQIPDDSVLKADGLTRGGLKKGREAIGEAFAHRAVVTNQRNRIVRTRPMFHNWSATFSNVYLDENEIDLSQLEQIAERAGRIVGLGDWRPRHGRFHTTIKPA